MYMKYLNLKNVVLVCTITVRIIPGMENEARPATVEEFLSHIVKEKFNIIKNIHNIHTLIRDAYSFSLFEDSYDIYDGFYGRVYTHRTYYDNINDAYIMFKGQVIPVPVRTNHLNPTGESTCLSLYDIISLYRFNICWHEVIHDCDTSLPDIAYSLGFKTSDKVKDWPLDPLLARYVGLNVITVYRHAHLMCGHFNLSPLLTAMAYGVIDLDDIDECQRWFDEKYNEMLTKFKSDVKHGRIKLV